NKLFDFLKIKDYSCSKDFIEVTGIYPNDIQLIHNTYKHINFVDVHQRLNYIIENYSELRECINKIYSKIIYNTIDSKINENFDLEFIHFNDYFTYPDRYNLFPIFNSAELVVGIAVPGG